MSKYLIGVDVGTGSARAGVFDAKGALVAVAKRPIDMFSAEGGIAEQSSAQIWQAVVQSVREAVAQSGVAAQDIAGLGFDATCSLVVLGREGASLPVGDPAHPKRDVIVWMDHRATPQAERINAGGYPVLRYVGERISPEMQTPKLLWLREENPHTYAAAEHFFDLTDFLTWKASGSTARSACTVTCKWTYLAHESRWDESYFRAIGLADLADQGFARIGQEVVTPGTALAQGLTPEAAAELGLLPGTAVASGLIDAHAGGLGTVGARGADPTQGAASRLGYVFGTSSCTMTSTTTPVFVPGVWGPYFSAMVPGLWLSEGGQSAAGAAIDRLIGLHPAHEEAQQAAQAEGKGIAQWLADRALQHQDPIGLAKGLHVVPEFLGNRAPFADPNARAVIAGLSMDRGLDDLLALYIAGLSGLGSGLRQILEAQTTSGIQTLSIVVSGGAGVHPLAQRLLADATGLAVEVTDCAEPVLLGSAMLGAVAAGLYPDLTAAMPAMSRVSARAQPDPKATSVHNARYSAFLALQSTARNIRAAEAG